jgi:hypothetical protein
MDSVKFEISNKYYFLKIFANFQTFLKNWVTSHFANETKFLPYSKLIVLVYVTAGLPKCYLKIKSSYIF